MVRALRERLSYNAAMMRYTRNLKEGDLKVSHNPQKRSSMISRLPVQKLVHLSMVLATRMKTSSSQSNVSIALKSTEKPKIQSAKPTMFRNMTFTSPKSFVQTRTQKKKLDMNVILNMKRSKYPTMSSSKMKIQKSVKRTRKVKMKLRKMLSFNFSLMII